jgi:carboxyl-terminal processing protease
MKYKNQLDDLLKVGNVDFAYRTFDRYLKRLDQRITAAQKWIKAEHDFSIDEDLVVDVKTLDWAKSDQEINERWRKRIKHDLLSLKLDDTPVEEARERLKKRYHRISKSEQRTDATEKLEMYLSAMTHCFDPHSSYMSPDTLEDFRIQMELKLQGIGAALRPEDGYTIVAKIIPGGAADKDGRLKIDDKIIGVAQETGEFVDVVEMKLKRVVRYIRGDKGTKVRLKVKIGDSGKVEVYELTRQIIELKSEEVKGEIIDVGDRLKGRQARVGVINIPSFYRDFRAAQREEKNFKSTARDVRKVLHDFRNKGVDVVVVDLRFNGGGALKESVEVSGLFIDYGPVVQVKEQNGRIKSHDDEEQGVVYAGPLVILCNRLSASASEIFAGAVRDYRRGIVVGDTTTHGKGTVQNVMPVSHRYFQFLTPRPQRGALKLTINQFYRVNGDSTQNHGVRSDVVLPSLLDNMDLGESFLDNALEFDRIRPANFAILNMVTPEIISRIRESSRRRIAADPKFKEVEKDIKKYLSRKNRQVVSLNEKTRRKEREDNKSDKDKKDKKDEKDKLENGEGPIFPDNHYNNEILRISLEYGDLLEGLKTAKN